MLYFFAKPDQMKDHKFSDDVAITFAFSKKRAIKKFSTLYAEVKSTDVARVRIKYLFRDCAILTSY